MEATEKHNNRYHFLPVTLSLETLGGISTPLIRRGTPLPTKRSQVFSTASDNQKVAEVQILLGERPLSKDNTLLGKCQLEGITPATRGVPRILVTFEVDTSFNVKVEASETDTNKRVEAKFEQAQTILTDELIQTLLLDAQTNKQKDEARLTITEAELRVQSDQRNNKVTAATNRIEELISDLGVALMNDNLVEIVTKTNELRNLLKKSKASTSTYDFGSFDNFFESFTSRKPSAKQKKPTAKRPVAPPLNQKTDYITPITTPSTHITALIQNFLEQVDPNLEIKRAGAWQTLESGTQDGPAQAVNSMREVLRQLLDNIAPEPKVRQAPWYQKPKDGSPVTRAMRIHYALTGMADIESESTLSLINGMAEAVNSMYSKLSAESHSEKRLKISTVRMYLNACEALIGLITTERKT